MRMLLSAGLLALISSSITMYARPYFPPHFYRAAYFLGEPGLDRDQITTIEGWLAGGSTKSSFDSISQKVPLFDLYGCTNLKMLGDKVPRKDAANPLDLLLIELPLQPTDPRLGLTSICGQFSLLEGILSLSYTFYKGLFFQANLPFSRYTVDSIRFFPCKKFNNCCKDTVPLQCNDTQNPLWQAFIENFDPILNQYCLQRDCITSTALTDVTLLLGWNCSCADSEWLDFIDGSIKVGVLIPTGKKQDINQIFAFPHGYNKRWGIPIILDGAIGSYEWLVLGAHVSALVLGGTTQCIRVNTSDTQSGIIQLTQAAARIESETLWNICAFMKADHALRFLSLLFGYTFTSKDATPLITCRTPSLNGNICNTPAYDSWKMHTLHFMAELDLTAQDAWWGTRLSFFYNRVVGGKRIVRTNMLGGQIGFDILLEF